MNNKIDLTKPILPVSQPRAKQAQVSKLAKGPSFQEIFQGNLQKDVQFSKHAKERLETRGISFTENQLLKLNQAVEKAARKGAKESLVLLDNLALIVSVTNKTVVTAVDDKNMKDNVFTNIDSAVII